MAASCVSTLARSRITGATGWKDADGWYGKLDEADLPRPSSHVLALMGRAFARTIVASRSPDPDIVLLAARAARGRALLLVNRASTDRVLVVEHWTGAPWSAAVRQTLMAGGTSSMAPRPDLTGTQQFPIDVQLPEEPAVVECDPMRIEQVVTNLISNAIKYSPDDAPVTVSVASNDEEVAVSVADRGIGLSEEERQRLFEPFRRVGLSKEAVPGVGLGLFVVKRIVDAHHGRIEVESEPGEGSTFRVLLPAA